MCVDTCGVWVVLAEGCEGLKLVRTVDRVDGRRGRQTGTGGLTEVEDGNRIGQMSSRQLIFVFTTVDLCIRCIP